MTPMMKQYYELKAKCPNAILFFRMGDFYEMFGEDALLAAPKLDIMLTSRERGDSQKTPFCGVPHHSAQNYWLKLLKLGFKVAIADQVEEASQAKGLVKREIIKIMSPGCIEDLEGLETDAPNYTMAIYEVPETGQWAIAAADISTGEFRCGNLSSSSQICDMVETFKPKELVVRRFCKEMVSALLASYCQREPLLIEELGEKYFHDKAFCQSILKEVFGKTSIASDLPKSLQGGVDEISAALLEHFANLQIKLNRFQIARPLTEPETMTLAETVIRDLEIFETSRRRQSRGSLFGQINFTLSPMGSRLLRWSFIHPFCTKKPISYRHQQVSDLIQLGVDGLTKIRKIFADVSDLERLTSRIVSRQITPIELAKIRDSLIAAKTLKDFFQFNCQSESTCSKFAAKIQIAEPVFELLSNALQASPGALGKGDLVFASGFDAILDEKLSLSRDGEKKVEEYQNKLRQETGINSLKIRPHKTFGLLIEITKSNLGKVSPNFIRRQTMINNERFVTEELKELDDLLASALELAVEREKYLYEHLVDQLQEFHSELKKVSSVLAEIDLLQGFAWLALNHSYTRPHLSEDNQTLLLEAARHPVVEQIVGSHSFMPNNLQLSKESKHVLITGPNMAGKSTVMRQTALCAILNQIGCFVPAKNATLPVFDQVFTRVGASDDLSLGLSTFMVEMSESAHILRNATNQSLVILDEVGRGTSTEDGLAIAKAILEHLVQQTRCWTMFATHYHELVPFSAKLDGIQIMQTEVVEDAKGITFTHRLIAGASGCSFGIEVASLAGILESVISKAKKYLSSPIIKEVEKKEKKELTLNHSSSRLSEISSKLENLRINRMTPLQALNTLDHLQQILQGASAAKQPLLFQDRQN